MTKSDDNNAMECRVGLAVAASVEPMAVGLARGSRYGIDTAQGGEGSLGVEAVRVTPGSNEEGRRRVRSYAVAIGLAKTFSHCEKTRLEVMPRERRSYRSAMRVNKTSDSSAPWGR